ncbi:hypothetical protein Bca4012_058592 [Brassica carinata]
MATPTGTIDRRRLSPNLNLSGNRHGRPQLRTTSMPGVARPAAARPAAARSPAARSPAASQGSAQPIPPGAAASSTAVSSAPPQTYVGRTEDALLRAPARFNQPHLHPRKLNGALWFGVDPEVHAFIRATWQGSYWGPWTSWRVVPDDKRDSWWHSFIQNYYWEDEFHDEIYLKWKVQTRVTICGRISQRRRACYRKNHCRQPRYISPADWAKILANGSTPEFKAKGEAAAKSRTSAPDGKEMHKHGAGPRCFANIDHRTMIDEGLEEPLSYPDLVRKTHSNADGSFIDKRAEALVQETEQAVEEIMTQDGSSDGSIISKRLLLNQEYIKRAQTSKGNIYGLGSVQYQTTTTSKSVPASLKRSLDMEIRMCGVETVTAELKADFSALRSDFNEGMSSQKATLDLILQALQPQASVPPASTTQATQPDRQAQAQAPSPSPAHDQSQTQGRSQPQHLMTNNNQSDLDKWCNATLGM